MYVALARGAALTGDTVETADYYQHAGRFFRHGAAETNLEPGYDFTLR